MYLCARDIKSPSFYDFDIWFWNFPDSVVFLDFHFIACDIYQTIKKTHMVKDEFEEWNYCCFFFDVMIW
jgi:hypothetical protein